uniref:Uncharacterized protein n=1 Tax=Trichogramma kaykai TaxID=54128 RepID=A0ABD2WXJ1_9HYME
MIKAPRTENIGKITIPYVFRWPLHVNVENHSRNHRRRYRWRIILPTKISFTSSTRPILLRKDGRRSAGSGIYTGTGKTTKPGMYTYIYTAIAAATAARAEEKPVSSARDTTSLRRFVPHHYYIQRERERRRSLTEGARIHEKKLPPGRDHNLFFAARTPLLLIHPRTRLSLYYRPIKIHYTCINKARKNLGREVNVRELARASDRSGLTSSSSSRGRKIDEISFRIFFFCIRKPEVYSPSSGSRVKVVILHSECSKNLKFWKQINCDCYCINVFKTSVR